MKSTSEYISILKDYMTKNAAKYGIIRMGIFGFVVSMCDIELVRSSLLKVNSAIKRILERSETILSSDDFLNTSYCPSLF